MAEVKARSNPSTLRRYGCALLLTALATLCRVLTIPPIGQRLPYTAFLVAVILACWYGGMGPGLLATGLGAVLGAHYAPDTPFSRQAGYLIVSVIVALVMNAQRKSKLRLEALTAERMRLEEKEKRERQWSHITLASIGDAVITTDSAGHVNFMNSVAESLTGWSLADAEGKRLLEVFRIVDEETGEPVENPLDRVLREGMSVGLANHTCLRKRDGSLIPIDDSGAPVRDDEHGTIGAVLVFRDVTERRMGLREIEDSRQRLELALDAGRMGTWDWEIGTGNVTWSVNLERIHGMDPGSFGGTFQDFQKDMHPDDRERVVAAVQRAVSTREPYRVEYRIVRPDGSMAWIEARGRLVPNERDEPDYMAGICMDVTHRKLVEEELRMRLAQQHAVARLGALALAGRDESKLLQTGAEMVAAELEVEYCSILEALQDGRGLILRAGCGWPKPRQGELIPPGRESQAGYTLLLEAPVVVEGYEAETRFQRSRVLAELGVSSGISVVIPGEDRPFGVLAAYAARRRAFTAEDTRFVQSVANIMANAIRRQREDDVRARLAAVLESSEDAIVSHSLEGVVETWNRGAEHVYGYSAAEMIGRSISILVPSQRIHEETSIREIVRRGESVQALETERVRKDGVPIQVSLTISPIRDRTGNVIAASHSGRDISERKRVEEKLQQTQKLESLGILAGGIAHDFNNLLTGILGNASLIKEVLPAPSPARPLAENVIQAAERAAHLTRQMLAYSGRGRFLVQPVNCSRQVREITALIAASIPKNVQVRLNLIDDLPLIEADLGQFQQLVMNLVINGAEAVGEVPGTVTVATGVEELQAADIAGITFAADLKPGRHVFVEVRDSGCGMDSATLAKIFDPFFTTKFTGRGLGLAAVLGIARGHSAAVSVQSAPGRGTTFRVLFPVAATQVVEPVPAGPEPISGSADTILIVDDEEMVRRTAQAALQKYGYRVVLAEDGKRAMEVFESMPGEIAVVLLDMTMPVISGEQTFQELRKIRPDLVVIGSSGFSEAEALARFGQGIAGFVQKPYSAATLAAKVAEVMARKKKTCGAG